MRSAGRTTWIRSQFSGAYIIDLLSEANYQRLLASPDLLEKELLAVDPGRTVVIDEIQRLPNLLHEVHRAIEERGMRFVLCGSSARKLKKAGVNLLAGRALQKFMHPFVPTELAHDFSLDQAMKWGLLPIVWDEQEDEKQETLEAYAQTYLKQEIQAEALVRNLPGFARFLPLAALCHGQTLNVAGLARDAGVARTTIRGYLDILQDTLLCFFLEGYEAKLRVRERKTSKLYWTDPGIVRTVRKRFGPLHPEEAGAMFEGIVAQIIRAHRDYNRACTDFSYWASTEAKTVEVDFLLAQDERFVAVEAKVGNRFTEHWCRGLRAIRDLPGLCRRLIVYSDGPLLQTRDGIEVVPLHLFTTMLADGSIWENKI